MSRNQSQETNETPEQVVEATPEQTVAAGEAVAAGCEDPTDHDADVADDEAYDDQDDAFYEDDDDLEDFDTTYMGAAKHLAAGIGESFKAALKNPEVEQGAKLGGEVLVLPGASLLLEGKFKPGALHAGAGLLAGAAFGLPGLALVAANSFSMSRTGRGLLSNLMGPKGAPDVRLKEEVAKDVAAGLSLEEINARVSEDVADLYEEAKAALADKETPAQ